MNKKKEFIVNTSYREGLPVEQLKLNQAYYDQSLEKLKERNKELAMLNQQLNQIVEEFLKEN